jgi:hypothetical protein
MAGKGNYFTDDCIRRITVLLATDMTIPAIAERMSCSRASVVSINRKFQVRAYAGKRATWEPAGVQRMFQSPS